MIRKTLCDAGKCRRARGIGVVITQSGGAGSRIKSRRASLRDLSRSGRNLLFATVEIESEARWNAVASTDVCQRWWKHMRDVMPAKIG